MSRRCSSSSCRYRSRRPRPPARAPPPVLFSSNSRRSLPLDAPLDCPPLREGGESGSHFGRLVVDPDVGGRYRLDGLDLFLLELVAAADDAEAAGAKRRIGADREAADRLPAEALHLERVHRDGNRRVLARLVVLVDRARDRLEVLGFGGGAHLTLSPPSSFMACSIVLVRPVRKSISGSQPRRSRARVMSG